MALSKKTKSKSPRYEVPIHRKIILSLHEKVILKAGKDLKKFPEVKFHRGQTLTDLHKFQKYGYDNDRLVYEEKKKSIVYALIKHFLSEKTTKNQTDWESLFKQFNNKLKKKFHLSRRYNGRNLLKWYQATEKLNQSWVRVDARYFILLCDFVAIRSPKEFRRSFLRSDDINEDVLIEQNKRWKFYGAKGLKDFQKRKHTYHYLMHFLYAPVDKQYTSQPSKLHSGRATFIGTNNSGDVGNVQINHLEDNYSYKGTFQYTGNDYDYFVAYLTENTTARPLTIHFANSSVTTFLTKEIVIGTYSYIDINHISKQGKFIFERVEHLNQKSKLDQEKLRYFLKKINEGFKPQNNVSSIVDVDKVVRSELNWSADSNLRKKFNKKYYEGYIIVDKDFTHHQSNSVRVLERILFYFPEHAEEVVCKSVTANGGVADLNGKVNINSNRVDIHIKSAVVGADYRFLLDIGNRITGSYTGISQSQKITSGRVILFRTSREEFDAQKAKTYNLKEGEHIDLFSQRKYSDLERFFSGYLDDYLDDCREFSSGFNSKRLELKSVRNFAGSYHFYRTRTSNAENTDAKRIPMLIREDGAVMFRFEKGAASKFQSNGRAFYHRDRLYLEFWYHNGYKGSAVFDVQKQGREKHFSGIYLGTEKHEKLICGLAHLYRSEKDIDQFLSSKFIYMNSNSPKTRSLSETELKVIKNLSGQLENYCIRHSTTLPISPDYGLFLFHAAKQSSREGNLELAYSLVELALWKGGFRDTKLFVQEIIAGDLQSLKPRILEWSKKTIPNDDTSVEAKQQRMLKGWALKVIKKEQ